MIKIFNDHIEAKRFVCTHNREHFRSSDSIALATNGQSVWKYDQQILIFPVLTMNYLPIIDCYDLFCSDLNLSDEQIQYIRCELESILELQPSVRMVSLLEWALEFQLINITDAEVAFIAKKVCQLNSRLSSVMEPCFGKMQSIVAQPSPLHKKLGILKIGVR